MKSLIGHYATYAARRREHVILIDTQDVVRLDVYLVVLAFVLTR